MSNPMLSALMPVIKELTQQGTGQLDAKLDLVVVLLTEIRDELRREAAARRDAALVR